MTTFEQYRSIPLDYSTIESHLKDLKFPKDKISKMEKTGELIRLKKGKYLIARNIKDNPPSLELIANHLYGPSYVSFETALSNHGWIPEHTYLIKSAISKRKKLFHTPLGSFEYIRVPEKYYSIGVLQYQSHDQYNYLIASPEKALCDLIITTKGLRIQSVKSMHSYLTEDLRLETDNLGNMSSEIVREAEEFGYKKQELLILRKLIDNYKS
ncbi:MAG: type IV toxin-antitoxin system AbiEi family antitoxin domain-containing protein [Bacteroidales bacterium]